MAEVRERGRGGYPLLLTIGFGPLERVGLGLLLWDDAFNTFVQLLRVPDFTPLQQVSLCSTYP